MIVYLRSHRRRPVRLGLRWGSADLQGEIPRSWCCRCGAEVFRPGAVCCSRCQKEDNDDEKNIC